MLSPARPWEGWSHVFGGLSRAVSVKIAMEERQHCGGMYEMEDCQEGEGA